MDEVNKLCARDLGMIGELMKFPITSMTNLSSPKAPSNPIYAVELPVYTATAAAPFFTPPFFTLFHSKQQAEISATSAQATVI